MAPSRVAANGDREPRCGGGISHRQVRSSSSAVTSRGNLAGRRPIPHRGGHFSHAPVAPYLRQTEARRTDHAAHAGPARRLHRRPDRRRGRRALVPGRRRDRRPAVLHTGHARLRRVLGGARPLAGRDRVLPHHGYTMIHVSAFIVVGTIAAVLAAEVEITPHTFYPVVVFFAIFEFGFYVTVAVLAQPLLGSLAWWNVAIGN